MAVEEINNSSTLLPGLRLGHDLLDTGSEPAAAVQPSLRLMARVGSSSVAAHCDYAHYRPRVLAVIGPHTSELALVTGKLFGFFLVPQVSPGLPQAPTPTSPAEVPPSLEMPPPTNCRSATAPAPTG